MGGHSPRANGQAEQLQGERPHVCGEIRVCGETHGRTRPQAEQPKRTARANGSNANGFMCVERHMCVGRHMGGHGPTGRTARANGSKANGPCVWGDTCVSGPTMIRVIIKIIIIILTIRIRIIIIILN